MHTVVAWAWAVWAACTKLLPYGFRLINLSFARNMKEPRYTAGLFFLPFSEQGILY